MGFTIGAANPTEDPGRLPTNGHAATWRNISERDKRTDGTAKGSSTVDATQCNNVVIVRGVTYLPAGRQEQADLYFPLYREATSRSPAVVIIHGGGWIGGKRDNAREQNIGRTLAANGYVAMSIDYLLATDLAPSWPQNIHDCKTAIRWLRANAGQLQIDADHIGVIGSSAGGHLTALLALTGEVGHLNPSVPYSEYSCIVQCAITMYGISEVRDCKISQAMLGQTRAQAPELYHLASPITYTDPRDPPFLIVHGTADADVPVEQSALLAQALQKAGVEHTLVLVPGATHSFDLQPIQLDLRPLVLEFFDKHLKPK